MIDLLVGDSLTILPSFPEGYFDVVVTSPPYNLGIEYRSGIDDNRPWSEYLGWTEKWLSEVKRVLSDSGSVFLNVGGKPTEPLGPFEVACWASNILRVQNVIYWIKSLSEDGGPCVGHVKPVNSKRFLNDAVEHVFHLTKTGEVEIDRLAVGVPYADERNLKRGTRGKNGNVRCRGNVWIVPYETIQDRSKDRPHPASFPPALAEMCFKLHGVSRIKRTLDLFSGLGSTARAAKRLGLDHVGIELSEDDVRDAERLLAEEVSS